MSDILQRHSVIDRLKNAQLVCAAWHEICEDPTMWRVVYVDRYKDRCGTEQFQEMWKHVVNKSQGQLVDLTAVDFCDRSLFRYVVDRSSQLRRLELVWYHHGFYENWSKVFRKLPLLEELNFVDALFSKEDVEALGRYCPLLKTLKVNEKPAKFWADDWYACIQNELALAIGKNLPKLTHLELTGNGMSNIGLQAVLDGCCHLKSLDLRQCWYIDLKGELGKRCSQQIKHLKLLDDSFKVLPYRG
ncbi:putative F-box/LRR-repeat protein 23 [Bidens hawaiensis]|uniref:putative F-box/LRR-repeat protein 23 n=1 Tax=Bidens hawaiensis TaxID=980011 RepID=UPI004049A803